MPVEQIFFLILWSVGPFLTFAFLFFFCHHITMWQQSRTESEGHFRKVSFCICCGFSSVQFSSVAQSCLTLGDPMDCSTPGLPVHHRLPESTQTHVHRVGDAIQPSPPLSSPSPPTFNLSQHQGLFQWVSSSYQVAEVLELRLQHQSFQWIFMTDLL